MSRRIVRIAAMLLALGMPAPSWAWNSFGHRVIAAIAFRELDPASRAKVVALLEKHPAATDPEFWKAHEFNGDDPGLNLFMNASIFPDDVRGDGPFHSYHISRAHYVNWRIRADRDGRVEDPAATDDDDPHGDVLESLATNVKTVKDASASAADRAVAMSWIFHQLGDLHQPLHTVARFTQALPGGDRGGNEVRVPGGNLHGYWDNALGRDEAPASVDRLAAELVSQLPRASLDGELALPAEDFRGIGREGVQIATGMAYRDLDPSIAEFAEFPVGYRVDAEKISRRRMALAGYRLAGLLKELAASLPEPGSH